MKFIEDGNFSGWLRVALFCTGLILAFGGLGFDQVHRWIRGGAFLLGFFMMALGGISSRAHMLKIKPFDNYYKNVRESYKGDGENKDQSN
ncbi:hypothetical protein [Burkholderia stabilis]|uniref:hypothetical protein n=1 Tax=Burkholderia stabilis TaxID=95485 RepID=UPI001F4BC754|nr:hypothetical protein [Burkholderia stabilis]